MLRRVGAWSIARWLWRDRTFRICALVGIGIWAMAYLVLRQHFPTTTAVDGTLARVGLFLGLLTWASLYGWVAGGAPERAVSLALLAQT